MEIFSESSEHGAAVHMQVISELKTLKSGNVARHHADDMKSGSKHSLTSITFEVGPEVL